QVPVGVVGEVAREEEQAVQRGAQLVAGVGEELALVARQERELLGDAHALRQLAPDAHRTFRRGARGLPAVGARLAGAGRGLGGDEGFEIVVVAGARGRRGVARAILVAERVVAHRRAGQRAHRARLWARLTGCRALRPPGERVRGCYRWTAPERSTIHTRGSR